MSSLYMAYKRLILHSAPATKMRQELVEDIKFTNISKLRMCCGGINERGAYKNESV